MKMKSISKIIAIALTAMMTVGLTACEDDREKESAYVYGTVVENTQAVSSPRSAVELADSHIAKEYPGRYLCIHLTVSNLNSTMTARDLITVNVTSPDDSQFYRYSYDIGDYYVDNIESVNLEPSMQYHLVYGFWTTGTTSSTATITVTDNYSESVIGEWDVSIRGIEDNDLVY